MDGSVIYGLVLHHLVSLQFLWWLLVLHLLYFFGCYVWIWAAVCILVMQRPGVMLKPFK
jgi:hypothetical protein